MKQSAKRLISFGLALGMIFGAIVLFISFVRPTYGEAQQLKGEEDAKKKVLENQRGVIKQISELKAEYSGDTELEQVISLSLPPKREESELIHMIYQLAELDHLGVQSVSVSPGAITPTEEGETGSIRPIGTVQMNIRFSGTYEGLKSFLRNLETNIRIMDVQTLTINPVVEKGASQSNYSFDIAVVTYYQSP